MSATAQMQWRLRTQSPEQFSLLSQRFAGAHVHMLRVCPYDGTPERSVSPRPRAPARPPPPQFPRPRPQTIPPTLTLMPTPILPFTPCPATLSHTGWCLRSERVSRRPSRLWRPGPTHFHWHHHIQVIRSPLPVSKRVSLDAAERWRGYAPGLPLPVPTRSSTLRLRVQAWPMITCVSLLLLMYRIAQLKLKHRYVSQARTSPAGWVLLPAPISVRLGLCAPALGLSNTLSKLSSGTGLRRMTNCFLGRPGAALRLQVGAEGVLDAADEVETSAGVQWLQGVAAMTTLSSLGKN